MVTINIDGTSYTIKNDRDPIALTALARKKIRKATAKASQRQFPTFHSLISTREYIERYYKMNRLGEWHFNYVDSAVTPQYDPSIPLVEVLE